jgi:hypothetical protein
VFLKIHSLNSRRGNIFTYALLVDINSHTRVEILALIVRGLKKTATILISKPSGITRHSAQDLN